MYFIILQTIIDLRVLSNVNTNNRLSIHNNIETCIADYHLIEVVHVYENACLQRDLGFSTLISIDS